MADISDFVDYHIPEHYRGKELPNTRITIPKDATGMFVDDKGTLRLPRTWVSFYDGNRLISSRTVYEFPSKGHWRIQQAAERYLEKNEHSRNPLYDRAA